MRAGVFRIIDRPGVPGPAPVELARVSRPIAYPLRAHSAFCRVQPTGDTGRTIRAINEVICILDGFSGYRQLGIGARITPNEQRLAGLRRAKPTVLAHAYSIPARPSSTISGSIVHRAYASGCAARARGGGYTVRVAITYVGWVAARLVS